LTRTRTLAAAALAAAVLVSGCGGDDTSESEPVETTELTITLDADGDGSDKPTAAEVSCPAANAPPEACRLVEELPDDATAPVPADTPCTEIYGGPDVVTVTGTLHGEQVDAEFTRANGCEIERFDRFVPLLATVFPEYEPGASLAP
jgi:hypothetical protein